MYRSGLGVELISTDPMKRHIPWSWRRLRKFVSRPRLPIRLDVSMALVENLHSGNPQKTPFAAPATSLRAEVQTSTSFHSSLEVPHSRSNPFSSSRAILGVRISRLRVIWFRMTFVWKLHTYYRDKRHSVGWLLLNLLKTQIFTYNLLLLYS